MRQLVRLVLLRHLRESPGRMILSMFGIVLGVGVAFSIGLVNTSVLDAFQRSLSDISGKAKLSIGSGVGVPETELERVRRVPGVAGAIPIIETNVQDVRAHRQLAVLALDTLSDPTARGYDVVADDARITDDMAFLNDPHGVLITPSYAKRTGAKVGDKLLLGTPQGRKEFSIHGTLVPRGIAEVYGGDLLLMDVYAAQIAFGRERRFDRIDVVPEPDADLTVLAARIAEALHTKLPVTRPEQRAKDADQLVAGYRLALSLASLVALGVGGFIIYNALAIAVARRRREIGILRALGAKQSQILGLFIGEGLLIGIIGAGLGLVFGYFLARASLGAVAASISTLYMPIKVEAIVVTARAVWISIGLGLAASTIAAFVPARRAAAIDPVRAMSATIQESDVSLPPAASLRVALLVMLLTIGLAIAAHVRQELILSITVAALLLLGGTLLSPALAAGIARIAQRYAKRIGPVALLGAVTFARNRGRNVVSTAALGLALANVVNVDNLVASMKGTAESWLDRSFGADIFVFAGTEVHAKFQQPLPPKLHDELRAVPQVEFVQAFRMVQQTFRGEPFYLLSENFEVYRRYNELAVVKGDLKRALPELEAGTGIAASEAFVRAFNVELGEGVVLNTPQGQHTFRIVLIYKDYRADLGILYTTRSAYRRIFRDDLVDLYSVYMKDDASIDDARETIAKRFGAQYGLLALGSEDYKRDLVGLIDRAMALGRATELVAVVVAGLGILTVLLVGVLDRKREIGVLKAIGIDQSQLRHVVLVEAMLIACTASVLGVLLGTAASAYVVLELLPIKVGWDISLRISWWAFAEAFVLALVLSTVAALWPVRFINRLPIVEALQYE